MQQIIILDQLSQPPAVPSFLFVMRLAVPPGIRNRYAGSVSGSSYPALSTDVEESQLRAGQYIEQVATYTGSATVQTWAQANTAAGKAQIKSDLIAAYTTAQNALNASVPWAYYGVTYDGTTWSV